LGSMAVVSIFHTHASVAGIRIEDSTSEPAFAGEPAVFKFRIKKTGKTAYSLQLSFAGEEGSPTDIAAGASAVVSVSAQTGKRGFFDPGPPTASSRYPFDLFRAWTVLPGPSPCLVYPEPVAGPDSFVSGGDGNGSFGGRAGRGVDDFDGLKSYQPGDSLQQISWKAYSKGQGLLTKQFSGDTGSVLFADWHAIDEPNPERKLSRLCALILHAHRKQRSYGLRLPGRVTEAGIGDSHLHHCLRMLALFGNPSDDTGEIAEDRQSGSTR